MSVTGSCLCGAVRYRIEGQPGPVWGCHCAQCRKSSGHFGAASRVDRSGIKIEGEPRWYESTPGVARRGFCPTCGSYLFWEEIGGDFFVMAGSMDETSGLSWFAHIYYAEKGDYYRCIGSVPCYAKGLSSEEMTP